MRKYVLFLSAIFFLSHSEAQENVQDEYTEYPVVFAKEKLQEDFSQFRSILESTHPALYDYTPKEILDSIFERNFNKINADLDFNAFLILMTEVISKVGCGHSSLWVPGKFWKVAPESLFPLKIVRSEYRFLVSGCYTDQSEIPVGSEILAINGQPAHTILNHLISLTSADGFNPSYRLTKATQNFSVKYAHAFGLPEKFQLEYATPGSDKSLQKTLKGVSKAVVDSAKPKRSELSFTILEDSGCGLLTINTFGYYSEVDMFHHFIDSVFQEMSHKEIQKLILDVRGNSGGDPFCASYLWSYLQPGSHPYFEDHYGKYDTLANPVPVPENHFKGRLFTLIDGNGFSTTGHFCGLLKYHEVGTFIGAELGSTYTCSGNATYPALKNTGIMVGTARVRRYTAAVKDMDPRRGVIPDHAVEATRQDIIEGKDAVLDFAVSQTK